MVGGPCYSFDLHVHMGTIKKNVRVGILLTCWFVELLSTESHQRPNTFFVPALVEKAVC